MTMKRYTSVVLSIFILLSLAACQTPAEPSESPPVQTTGGAASAVSPAPGVSAASTQVPDESAAPVSATPEPAAASGEASPDPGAQISPDGPVAVERVVVSLASYVVIKGTILDPNVLVMPGDAADKSFTLSSSNDSVIRQVYGFWTAVGGGKADLIATTANGVRGAVTVTVIVPLEGLALSAGEITINRGDSIRLTPVYAPADTTETRVEYISSDASIATVSEDGMVRAVGAGAVEIRCVSGEFSAACTVTVVVPVTGISLSTDRRTYEVGAHGVLTVQISPPDATDQLFTTEISSDLVRLDGSDSFTCVSGGDATITVTASNGMTARQTITAIDLVAYANDDFRLTNSERVNAGLEPFSMMSSLTQTAVVRAGEIIQNFSHDRPDGRSCFTAYDENSVRYTAAGENIAMGQRTPSEVVRAWMDSAGHRENIMKEDFGHLGVGVAMDGNGRLYWSQNFTD